jgi:hypothetical protein
MNRSKQIQNPKSKIALSWDYAEARAAVKVALGEKSSFLALHAFPADVDLFVGGFDKSVVMLDQTVAHRASDDRFFRDFRIE